MIATNPTSQPIVTVRLGTFTARRRRDITSPARPPHPFGSPDVLILSAWIAAEEADPAPACRRPQPAADMPNGVERCGECPACKEHEISVLAAVESAIERCLGMRNTSGQVSDVYGRIPAWMRPTLGLPAGEGLKRLLGRWGKDGAFQPAQVAPAWQLTEEEAAVYWWDIRGWTLGEIQRELTPRGLRGDRERWRDAEEVHEVRERARRKVRGMFGVVSVAGVPRPDA